MKSLPSIQIDITRSADFWYKDGTIVLQVEATQFRVHRGVLATHSNFFAGMFEIPQPEQQTCVEGCQLVCMLDAATDWEDMLMVMYRPIKANPLSPNLSVRRLLSMHRLGKKYQFDDIYEGALMRLKSKLPSTVDQYGKLSEGLHFEGTCLGGIHCKAMACRTCNLFQLINAALELKIEVVLPVAYYMACSKDINVILNGSVGADGTVVGLPRRLQEILLVGREDIRRAIMNHTFPWIFGEGTVPIPCKGCKSTDDCQLIFLEATRVNAYISMVDVDYALEYLKIEKLCRACNRTLRDAQSTSRAVIWDNLPSYFDLPCWKDLMD